MSTTAAPAVQQHIPSAGLSPQRRIHLQRVMHNDTHEMVHGARKNPGEMGSQILGTSSLDVERQGQQLELRVGKNHGVVSEVQLMKTCGPGTFNHKTIPLS